MAARITSEFDEPSQPKTRYAPSSTPGATPTTPGPPAPTMPATWVPWPLQSPPMARVSGPGSGTGVSLAGSLAL